METPPPTEITPSAPPSSSQPLRLADKIAIVTGGASGLGRAISLSFAQAGAHVVIADLRPTSIDAGETEATHEVIQRNGGKAVFVKTDVSSAESVDAVVEEAVRWGGRGRIDVMVNNAGLSLEGPSPKPIFETSDSVWNGMMAVNATGVFYGCRAASRQMVKQEPLACGSRGWIINLSSIYGSVALAGICAYVSTKHLVMGLTKAAALDLAPHRIHVNALCPGFTRSTMTSSALADPEMNAWLMNEHPYGGVGEPDYIARAAVFLASEDAKWVHGHGLVVDGGFVIH